MSKKRGAKDKTPNEFACSRCPNVVLLSDSDRRKHQKYCAPEVECKFMDGTKKRVERNQQTHLFTCPGQGCETTSQLGEVVQKCARRHNPPSAVPLVADSSATAHPTPTLEPDASSYDEEAVFARSRDSAQDERAKRNRLEDEEETGSQHEQQEETQQAS